MLVLDIKTGRISPKGLPHEPCPLWSTFWRLESETLVHKKGEFGGKGERKRSPGSVSRASQQTDRERGDENSRFAETTIFEF